MATKPITIHITWRLKPGSEEAFYKALKPVYEKLTKQEQLQYFNVFKMTQQPDVYRMVEIWNADVSWIINVQSQQDFYKTFFETVKPLTLQEREIELLESVQQFRFMK